MVEFQNRCLNKQIFVSLKSLGTSIEMILQKYRTKCKSYNTTNPNFCYLFHYQPLLKFKLKKQSKKIEREREKIFSTMFSPLNHWIQTLKFQLSLFAPLNSHLPSKSSESFINPLISSKLQLYPCSCSLPVKDF